MSEYKHSSVCLSGSGLFHSGAGTVEFYSAMKKNEMLTFAGKSMELEIILLNMSESEI